MIFKHWGVKCRDARRTTLPEKKQLKRCAAKLWTEVHAMLHAIWISISILAYTMAADNTKGCLSYRYFEPAPVYSPSKCCRVHKDIKNSGATISMCGEYGSHGVRHFFWNGQLTVYLPEKIHEAQRILQSVILGVQEAAFYILRWSTNIGEKYKIKMKLLMKIWSDIDF